MSPALTASSSLPATTISGSQPLPVITQWTNPIPEGWRELDEKRKVYFQAQHNMILEMHPNGIRGVNATTKFCVLTILVSNITGIRLNNDSSQQLNNKDWNKNSGTDKSSYWRGQSANSRHVIVGNYTGLFLCMDDRSVVYQSRNFNTNHCVFDHEYDPKKYNDRYYRRLNETTGKWYLGMNKDGSIRCGNVTRKKQSGAIFTKNPLRTSAVISSPPFSELKKECCTNKSCKTRRKNAKDRENGKKRRKKRCYKKWCKKHRRRFFTLKLKELRRYYNRCVKGIRHCHKKGKKEVDR